MFSSQNTKKDIVFSIYKYTRTVFRLSDVALLTGETNFQSLNKKLNYYVRKGKLQNPRKGIYTKPDYNPEELACIIYTPSYISQEYILQKAGVIFQYDTRITATSYLSRTIVIAGKTYAFRKIKGEILVNTSGIIKQGNNINIATTERAFLDLLYLNKDYYFDNLKPLRKKIIYKLLSLYKSKSLTERVNEYLRNG